MNTVPWHAFHLLEPENMSHELANNSSCVSIISTVTRLQVVKPSSLGSIGSKNKPNK